MKSFAEQLKPYVERIRIYDIFIFEYFQINFSRKNRSTKTMNILPLLLFFLYKIKKQSDLSFF